MKSVDFGTLILMPYFPLRETVRIENLYLWSVKNELDKYITDQRLKDHILKIASCYRYSHGEKIGNPTIISINNTFCNPTEDDYNFIEKIKNILLFSCILNNDKYGFITSDNFEVFYQGFEVGNLGIVPSGGAIHRITIAGYTIDKISFIKPDYINIPHGVNINTETVSALTDCLNNQSTDPSKNQIIQSLNPFFNAYRNSHELSSAGRILLMIMAFEILFGESSENKLRDREHFRDSIKTYSTMGIETSLTEYTYPIINERTGKEIYLQLTQNQIWAEEFYKLRNRIIHGKAVNGSDFMFNDLINLTRQHDPHFSIAINFFVVCIINKLRHLGYTSVPHLIINPLLADGSEKNISGIENEVFKIEDLSFYEILKKAWEEKINL